MEKTRTEEKMLKTEQERRDDRIIEETRMSIIHAILHDLFEYQNFQAMHILSAEDIVKHCLEAPVCIDF